MLKRCLRLSFILLLAFLCTVGLISTSEYVLSSYRGAVSVSLIEELSSVKDWQDRVSKYINSRNELINNILDGKCTDIKKAAKGLKDLECAPLLEGDISMADYMIKNPGRFTSRINNMLVEYCDIRQLAPEEVIILAKISFLENNMPRKYDYDIVFKNIKGRWYLSKFTYAE